jgi:cation diffusion facilitator family transporter
MANNTENGTKMRALRLSAFAIASVVLVEVTLGFMVSSLAIISDGLHASLDLIATIMLFVAAKVALKPPDEEHLYGHEKFETIGGLIGGIILLGVAIIIFYEAIMKSVQGVGVNESLGLVGFAAIGFTFCIDLFRIALFRTAKGDSSTVKVGFYHALADLSSTVIAFIGFGLAVAAGIFWGDSVASIALSILLSYLSVGLIRTNIMELSDTASRDMIKKTKQEIGSEAGVFKTKNLRARKVGAKYFIEATIQVQEGMSLDEAHSLASRIEANLTKVFGNVDSTLHIEPGEKGAQIKQLIEKLATVNNVREVHEIETVYASGKLYVTLHAIVDPALSVEKAHEIAEDIETSVHGGLKQLEHVTVHVEPYNGDLKSIEISENELNKIVGKVADGLSPSLKVEKVLTYVAAGKRYINLTCCFTKEITISEAHELASAIEKKIKERFANTIVTVHIEPICNK